MSVMCVLTTAICVGWKLGLVRHQVSLYMVAVKNWKRSTKCLVGDLCVGVLVLTCIVTAMTKVMIPLMANCPNYTHWKSLVQVWEDVTELKPEKRADAMLLT